MINAFTLSELDSVNNVTLEYTTKVTLSLNEIELTDRIFQSPFWQQTSLYFSFFSIDSRSTISAINKFN